MESLRLQLGTVDLRRRTLDAGDGDVRKLTTKEAEVLAYLASRPGEDVSREELLQEVWGYRGTVVSRTVDTTMQRLRKKIERAPKQPDHLLTVHGAGYRFEPLAEAPAARPPAPLPQAPADPVAGDALVGRTEDLDRVAAALAASRLVTLAGPGGVGKTTLARRFGGTFCDLSAASHSDDVRRIVAAARQVPLTSGKAGAPGSDPDARLAAAMEAAGPLRLVLDNAEQVVGDVAALVTAWLAAAPSLTVLATSREALGVAGEAVVELAPLAADDALDLFVARAREARAGFALDDDEAAAAARELVARLDGLPLALELAAARAGVLGPAGMLRRLDDRFRLLVGRRRDVPDRQRTLRAALDWSWDLLDDDEQRTLASCGAFRGGFDADAVDAVVDIGVDATMWPLDVVEGLRAKSLITAAEPPDRPGELRLGLLESVRAYAAARLDDDPELRAVVHARHRDHYLARGEALLADLVGPDPVTARRALAAEIDNLEAVRRRCLTAAAVAPSGLDPATGTASASAAALAAARAALILFGVLWSDAPAARTLAILTECDGPLDDGSLKHRMLVALARAHRLAGDPAAGLAAAEEAVALAARLGGSFVGAAVVARGLAEQDLGRLDVCEATFREADAAAAAAGDADGRTAARTQLAYVMSQRGKHDDAEPLVRAALADNRSPLRVGKLRSTLGLALMEMARWEEADRAFAEALEAHRSIGDRRGEAIVRSNIAGSLLARGRTAEAERSFAAALAIFESLGDQRLVGMVSRNLGVLALSEGRDEDAAARFAAALSIHRRTGDGWNLGRTLADLGEVRLLQGDYADAEAQYREGAAMAESLGDRRYAAIIAGNLALLAHVAGDLAAAADRYPAALAAMDEATGARVQGYYRAYAAVHAAESGDVEGAERLLGEASALLEQVGDPVGLAVIEACTAAVELATASEAHGEPERARLAASADDRLAALGSEASSYDVRIALLLADRIRLD